MKQNFKKNKKFYQFLSKLREILRIIYNTKTRSRFFWNLRNGDNSVSLNYPLNNSSLVFDIGAYNGTFTQNIYEKFNCNIYAFEPLTHYFEFLNTKFLKDKNKIKIYNFGLLDKSKTISFSNIDFASSIYSRPEGELSINVEMRSFYEFVTEKQIDTIDLVYINIEGSEYKLLEHIIASGYINNIKYLQIQFHNFVDNSKLIRKKIRKDLKNTHKCIHNYPLIWEVWKIK